VARRIFNALDRGCKLIVIDPRRTPLARRADIHLQHRPGTDIPLLNCLMRLILDDNLHDDVFVEMRTENFNQLRDMLFRLEPEEKAAAANVPLARIRQAAELYGRANKAVICYCLGITQHICGTDNVQTIANLAMLTGNVEKEDTGVDPLRGQNNVQGACDMGALPGVFPGYQAVSDEAVRQKFARAWQRELPAEPGLTLLDMTHGSGRTVKGMYIMGENPLLSDPTLARVRNTLENLEFLAVSDIFLTETAELAHVVFPAASFAEKTGTFTNSERRVQMVRRAIKPIGRCRTDSEIICALSSRLGYEMSYESSAEIMEEIALLTPIYGGMYHDRLESSWGRQWPCFDRRHPGTKFLHKYNFARGRGCFVPAGHQMPGEQPNDDYPFLLMTGRIYHHYHTAAMTRACAMLNRESPEALLEINPADAGALALDSGDWLQLATRRGSIRIRAQVSKQVAPGMLYTSFHFSEAPVNLLTNADSDPKSKCPEYKICAARVEKIKA
jgi:formate dehydrogenase major subunit/formate dehydrogenase alpha subunit